MTFHPRHSNPAKFYNDVRVHVNTTHISYVPLWSGAHRKKALGNNRRDETEKQLVRASMIHNKPELMSQQAAGTSLGDGHGLSVLFANWGKAATGVLSDAVLSPDKRLPRTSPLKSQPATDRF